MCGRANRMEDQPESSTTDEKADGERAIIRMDAMPKSWRQMESEKPLKVLKKEWQGWWTLRKFDWRVRMRAFAMGVVNDALNNILLDTGANISATSESFARNL